LRGVTIESEWTLQVDYRERESRLLQLARESGLFRIQMRTLKAGDFIINGRVVVERKSYADFANSILDGRLFQQVSALTRLGLPPLLIVEGPPPTQMPDVHRNALKGAVLSTAVSWRVPVVFSRNGEDSLLMLRLLARQSVAPGEPDLPRYGGKPKRLSSRKLYVLQGLPGVGPKLARRLLGHFGSVEKVFQAEARDLVQVEGCGPKRAAAICRILRS